jgi:DNA primase
MAQHRLSEQTLVDAGIFSVADQDEHGRGGRSYPRWRHRLMFPIRNDNGDVIAFSGRILAPEQKGGKYVNSPETALFNKSRVLFGFDKSKRFISKAGQAIICEGQIDMIMIFEAGLQNVVAGQGTAFTEQHAKMLKRLCNEVILCYDSDTAGRKAAERAFELLSPHGLSVRVAALPQGEDPDSLIREKGALNRMVARVAKNQNNAPKSESAPQKPIRPEEDAKKLVSAQNPNSMLLCQLALADSEVLFWLRETECEEILSEVPGTELLGLLWRSRYDPSNEVSRTTFMSGLERELEAAFSMLLARKRPPGDLSDAMQALDALNITRLQNLLQRTKGRLRLQSISAKEMEDLQHKVMELNSRLKESLDRLRSPQNSRPLSS